MELVINRVPVLGNGEIFKMKNISCSDTKQLFKIFSDVKETKLINVTDESYVQQYHSNLIEYIKIKKLDKSDLSYVKEDFENVSREAFSYMRGLLRFYEEIIKLSDIVTWKFDFHKALALDCIVLSQFFYSDHFWSDERCSAIAYKILNQLLNFFKCKNINELFFGGDNINKAFKKLYPNGVLKLLLEEFVSIFKKNSWKNYPSYKDTFSWILFNVQSPQMSDYVVYFLPPALFILDDWELENKVYGVKALQHMMKNLPSSELRWYGRANVIFDALNHNLHTREPSVLEVAYPATILAASILEKCPKTAKSMQKKFYDGLMDRLLSEMNFEQMLKLRTIYAHALKLLVEEMKLFSVK
ncbi:TELO2-interacting protein 2 [Armadillidium vulgare]|nr:TELO2-interacting protein 2 [Armadillidium vulgare]